MPSYESDKSIPTHDDMLAIAKSIEDKRDRALFVLAYLTAGRINEILPKKFILRRKLDKETKATAKWREEINYPGITKKDIEFKRHHDRDFLVITMLNEKNKKKTIKTLPTPIDKEGEFVSILYDYLVTCNDADVLFPFSDVTAWKKIKRIGFNPHFLRHIRTTHLITFLKLSRQAIIEYLGWSDDRPLRTYAHLFWTDLADEM